MDQHDGEQMMDLAAMMTMDEEKMKEMQEKMIRALDDIHEINLNLKNILTEVRWLKDAQRK